MSQFQSEMEERRWFRGGLRIMLQSTHIVTQDIEQMKTTAEQFISSNGNPIVMDGLTIINMYRRWVYPGQIVRLSFAVSIEHPMQGVRLKVDKGKLLVNGKLVEDVVIWRDSAPSEIEIICHPKGEGGELRVWNCWRDKNDVMQAWVGNSGIVVEESERTALLRCSAGAGDFSPDDMRVTIKFS